MTDIHPENVPARDVEALASVTQELIQAGQWEKARATARQLVSLNPGNPWSHAALGHILVEAGELEEAEKSLRNALDRGADDEAVYMLMMEVYNGRADFAGQLEWAQRAAGCGGKGPAPYFAIADAHRRLGQYAEAEKALRYVAETHPENARARGLLGDICLAQQRPEEAAGEYRAGLEHDRGNASLWASLGYALKCIEDFRGAVAAYKQALQLQPLDAQNAYDVGDTLLSLDETEKAIGFLTRAVQLKPDFALAHYDLGLAFFTLGKYKECAAASQAALRSDPQMKTQQLNVGHGATTNLGLAHYNMGKYAEAEECFRRNLGQFSSTYFNLGLTLCGQKRFEEALKYLRHAIEIEPRQAEYLDVLGETLSELGRPDEAMEALKASIAIDPDYAPAHHDMGMVLSKLIGKEAEAIRAFKRSIALEPDNCHSYHGISCVYARQGKEELALKNLEKALQRGCTDIEPLEGNPDWACLKDDPRFMELKKGNRASILPD